MGTTKPGRIMEKATDAANLITHVREEEGGRQTAARMVHDQGLALIAGRVVDAVWALLPGGT